MFILSGLRSCETCQFLYSMGNKVVVHKASNITQPICVCVLAKIYIKYNALSECTYPLDKYDFWALWQAIVYCTLLSIHTILKFKFICSRLPIILHYLAEFF